MHDSPLDSNRNNSFEHKISPLLANVELARLALLKMMATKAIPSATINTLDDAQFTWIIRDRLGVPQAATAHLLSDCRTCNTGWGNGYHARTCKAGGGRQGVHDSLVSAVYRMARAAGFQAQLEPRNLVTGTSARPADVLIPGLRCGTAGDDTAIDVTVRDNRSKSGWSKRDVARMLQCPNFAAVKGEQAKSTRKVRGGNGESMEDYLRAIRINFVPLGFTIAGAPGANWSNLLKKISDEASVRKGHDAAYFRQRWTGEIAMLLAKRGAEAALRRARAVREPLLPPEVSDIVGPPSAEPVMYMDAHDYRDEYDDI